MPEAMRRNFLKDKEATQLLDDLNQKLKVDIKQLFGDKKPRIEVSEAESVRIFYVDGRPVIASVKGTLIPTLLFEKALALLPKITVNMGAVPHICNGADLMAPGIVRIEGDFGMGDYVLVVDELHGKPLAVVSALADSQTARSLKHGKVAKNVHYVGDGLWKELKRS